MNKLATIATVAILLMISGCAGKKMHTPAVEFPDRMVFRYTQGDGKILEKQITRSNTLASLVEKYFSENTSAWLRSWDTFAPLFEYQAPNFLINVRSDFIVVQMKQADGRWIQFKRHTPANLWKEICGAFAIESNFRLQP